MSKQEGVIQYTSEYRSGPKAEVSDIEGAIVLWRLARSWGWIGQDITGVCYGNASQRDQYNPNSFWITGTQTGCKDSLRIEDWCCVTGWDFKANRVVSQGPIRASSEAMTHAAIYTANPLVHCVAHVHTSNLWTVLQQDHSTSPESAGYGTPDIAFAVERIAKDSKPPNLIILLGHQDGLLFWGSEANELEEYMSNYRLIEQSIAPCV